jgi:serine/threonine protein kinase
MALSVAQMVQMSRLLDEALPLDATGRRRWLEQKSAQHRELATALRQSLLPNTGVGLASIDLEVLPKIDAGPKGSAAEASDLKPNDPVGPYRLVRLLGAGGMAEVWLAHRADGAFKREVAVKLPLVSRLRPDLVQRFAHEREILAGLEHTHIARMYDAGVRPDGRPYLVMEYVPGAPLIDWCDARRLELRERIHLFLQLLDAVQYAHARRVIHRDLKPSNILVTPEGQLRLLDFGAARRLADPDKGRTQLTRLYGQALTPDYASPELLRGESGSVESDIYSLGVVLYELLTGARPYRIKAGESVTQLEQQIAAAPAERPSAQLAPSAGPARATTQRKLARLLCGDLDAIVLKALCPARHRRYDSVSALADDLWRYLRGSPVDARAEHPIRRAGKFLLRHRAGAAAAFVALAALGLALTRVPMPVPADVGASVVRMSDRSIAVLPFADMSEKKDQEYVADGMAEEIRDLLSNVPQLQVTARTSASYFKGRRAMVREISRALGVAHVLEGSVRNSGNRLRVSVQLVRADNGYQVWSQTYEYERNPDDLFKVQDDIAKAVVKALRATLLPEAGPDLASAQAPNGVASSLEPSGG